jgi:hypothetical protein
MCAYFSSGKRTSFYFGFGSAALYADLRFALTESEPSKNHVSSSAIFGAMTKHYKPLYAPRSKDKLYKFLESERLSCKRLCAEYMQS